MRHFTLIFMEQRIGTAQLKPVDGGAGSASFTAPDEEAAVAHIQGHFIDRIKGCARAELSSMRVVLDAGQASGFRLVDDSHSNPHFQDTFVKYNPVTGGIDVDFESTRTMLLAELPVMKHSTPRSGTS